MCGKHFGLDKPYYNTKFSHIQPKSDGKRSCRFSALMQQEEPIMKQYKVGIIGATGMVGQRFVTLMENHPLSLIHI